MHDRLPEELIALRPTPELEAQLARTPRRRVVGQLDMHAQVGRCTLSLHLGAAAAVRRLAVLGREELMPLPPPLAAAGVTAAAALRGRRRVLGGADELIERRGRPSAETPAT